MASTKRGAKTATVSFEVPVDAIPSRYETPEEFTQAVRLAAAAFWYSRTEISMERAAGIAGLNIRDFLLALGRERVDFAVIDIDDLRRELARG